MASIDGVRIESATPDHATAVSELVWSTGPSSYSYIFGERRLFDVFVQEAWRTPDSYFGHTDATLARDGERVVGVEIGFAGERNYETRANLAGVSSVLRAGGRLASSELAGILGRAEKASYLNPHVPHSAYYVLALAVVPEVRGRGVGARLLAHALKRARAAGCRSLHLDVLSDNAAVSFYRAHGLETVAETVAPEPHRCGVPMEMRMTIALAGDQA